MTKRLSTVNYHSAASTAGFEFKLTTNAGLWLGDNIQAPLIQRAAT